MADVIGAVIATTITLLLANLQSMVEVPALAQVAAVVLVVVVNLIVWRKNPPPPMSVASALMQFAVGAIIVAVIGLIDILIGKANGAPTLEDAVFASGPFGGVVDLFLLLLLLLVGIPSLARAVYLGRAAQRPH
ncbi:hypothetical protein [Hydrogenophaga sp. RWCD_12]|uniref:hypothetical protein n=1 Tax=Hydrogenophaga sp. RWCD_12 TaxID=3391190 RepID=UPI00398525DC